MLCLSPVQSDFITLFISFLRYFLKLESFSAIMNVPANLTHDRLFEETREVDSETGALLRSPEDTEVAATDRRGRRPAGIRMRCHTRNNLAVGIEKWGAARILIAAILGAHTRLNGGIP